MLIKNQLLKKNKLKLILKKILKIEPLKLKNGSSKPNKPTKTLSKPPNSLLTTKTSLSKENKTNKKPNKTSNKNKTASKKTPKPTKT